MDRRPGQVRKTIGEIVNGWISDNACELIILYFIIIMFQEWLIPILIIGIPVLFGWSFLKKMYYPD